VILADLVSVSEAVSATRSRSKKVELLAATLRRLSPDEAPIAVSYLTGKPRQARLNVGWATVYRVESGHASESVLEILEVDGVLDALGLGLGFRFQEREGDSPPWAPGPGHFRRAVLSSRLASAQPETRRIGRGHG
jgi:hypothetical protein